MEDNKTISPEQILFPDRRTLEEVIKELREEIKKLKEGSE